MWASRRQGLEKIQVMPNDIVAENERGADGQAIHFAQRGHKAVLALEMEELPGIRPQCANLENAPVNGVDLQIETQATRREVRFFTHRQRFSPLPPRQITRAASSPIFGQFCAYAPLFHAHLSAERFTGLMSGAAGGERGTARRPGTDTCILSIYRSKCKDDDRPYAAAR